MIHAEKSGDLDRCGDLLAAFTDRGVARVLVVVDEPAGQAPEAQAWLDRPTAKQHTAVDLDDHRGDHLRVVPQDEVVVRAGLERAALDDSRLEDGAAFDAEVVGHRPPT